VFESGRQLQVFGVCFIEVDLMGPALKKFHVIIRNIKKIQFIMFFFFLRSGFLKSAIEGYGSLERANLSFFCVLVNWFASLNQ
jgi:hypothetical protein